MVLLLSCGRAGEEGGNQISSVGWWLSDYCAFRLGGTAGISVGYVAYP